jgi:hypothetical protein
MTAAKPALNRRRCADDECVARGDERAPRALREKVGTGFRKKQYGIKRALCRADNKAGAAGAAPARFR